MVRRRVAFCAIHQIAAEHRGGPRPQPEAAREDAVGPRRVQIHGLRIRERRAGIEGPPFVDAWARTRPLDSGATFPNPETMDLDAARPDRVLARGLGLRPRAAAVLGCDLVDGAKGHAPSDHRLLVVDLEVVAP